MYNDVQCFCIFSTAWLLSYRPINSLQKSELRCSYMYMYYKVNSKFMKEKSSNLFCMLPTIWAYCGEISFILIFSPSRYEYSTIVEQSKHTI